MPDYKVKITEVMHFTGINSVEELNDEINEALQMQLAAGDGVDYEWEELTHDTNAH